MWLCSDKDSLPVLFTLYSYPNPPTFILMKLWFWTMCLLYPVLFGVLISVNTVVMGQLLPQTMDKEKPQNRPPSYFCGPENHTQTPALQHQSIHHTLSQKNWRWTFWSCLVDLGSVFYDKWITESTAVWFVRVKNVCKRCRADLTRSWVMAT